MRHRGVDAYACLLPPLTAVQAALPPDPPAETIVIIARALPDSEAERAYSVQALKGAALRNAPTTQLDQILTQVPGLQLFRRSDARSAHPTSQGVTMRALGGNAASRALLTLDGVPQTDPFGGWVNWPAYDPASLAEVRVVRGGGGVGHGPGALAGTIEMTSRLDPGVAAGLDAGSRESLEGRLLAGAPLGGGRLAMSVRGAIGAGFVPVTAETRGTADRPAPYREASVRGIWVAPLSAQTDLQLSALGFTDRRERGVAFTANRTYGADGSLRLVGNGRWQWSALGYVQWRELSSSFASVSPGRAIATRVSLQDSVPSNALGGSLEVRPPVGHGLELRLGGDVRRTNGESRELFSFVEKHSTRRRIAGGETLTAGLFGEATATLDALTLSGGARLDRWSISDGELRERVLATGEVLREDRYPSRSGALPTARAGVIINVGHGVD
ncbi:MAG: TonB-dependent receptor plug domain-containing protein, partial [Sphingomonas sp.]|nr:TonB-dependent receptor plug domain-containing protein [Sphingomonas sp.]